jgi:flagellar motor switch/type III secretory pathway protein FliN
VRLTWRLSPANAAPDDARAVFLETFDGAVSVSLELEPALASLVLARVLGRRDAVPNPDAVLDPGTRGALAAVLVEAARRAGGQVILRARAGASGAAMRMHADVTVFVDAKPYHVAARASVEDVPTAELMPAPSLDALGGVPVRLPLVVARSAAAARDLTALRRGDVWLPGDGLFAREATSVALPRRVLARAALSAASAEWGVEVGCSDGGPLVLRGNIIALGADVPEKNAERAGGAKPMSGNDETLTNLALDAPLVVRIEVGSVTLTARDWAELRPGDVLETGLRLSEPAVLRVAGREVARGELVSVDGELGVRIREIIEGERKG